MKNVGRTTREGAPKAPSIKNEKPVINAESESQERQQYAREREEEIRVPTVGILPVANVGT